MTDQPSDSNRIPFIVNPHAHYLPNTPEWEKLAPEFELGKREPIACIAIPGSVVSPSFSQFGVQALLRANYQGLVFGDKMLRLRVFRFEQPATVEMIMAVDVANPEQPFIEWQVWTHAAPVLALVNIPAARWVKEAKAFAPGFDLLVQSSDRMRKQTREAELTKEQFRPLAIKAAIAIGQKGKKLSRVNLGKELLLNRDTISKYIDRDEGLWDELVTAHREL